MMCVKIIELIGTSNKSFEDAIQDAINTASKSLRGISGVDVVGQTALVENNKITEFRVNVKVAFSLEK
ncbi:MAG: dodecin domain-containing protein [Candidatus Buchananbacteria bacterium]|nr:dodecin domain-containing protein [Candidatus Buchananbacteria bacterium]